MKLSKSKLLAHRQCPKRLYLQVRRPELAQRSEASENRMVQGHRVGAAAQRLFPGGRLIAHVDQLQSALKETRELLAAPGDVTLFEPALRTGDLLVRADILERRGGRYRMIEVKSSTHLKPYHVTDAAIQTWVVRGAGVDVGQVEVAHIDNRFVYAGDGDYRGLFAHDDVTEAVAPLQEQIPMWIEAAQRDLAGPMPDVAVGPQCGDPFECEFLGFCAPTEAEYPVDVLPNSRRLAQRMRDDGITDLRDVPPENLKSELHQRIHRVTNSGKPELDPAAAEALSALGWPRYYVDFETVGPAVPMWAGTRPYQKIPMQFSCRRQEADGTLAHLPPFLDTSGDDPRRPFAERLVATVGDDGPVFVYNIAFEGGVIRQLAELFPDLAPALQRIAARLADLLPLTRDHYYHPAMMGSFSIKRVLPTIAPELDYAKLDGVQSGDMVEPVYLEIVDPSTPPGRRDALRASLLAYCERDTLAMVALAAHLAGERPASNA
ncbi:MAG: DUF2779 domain-containing protein [Burkholderiales bacterium]